MTNIALNFVATARRLPAKPFVVSNTAEVVTYGQMLRRALKLVGYLQIRGIRAGDRVMLLFPNSIDYLTAYLAVQLMDCTALPVDFRSRFNHIEFVMQDTNTKLCLTSLLRPEFSDNSAYLQFPRDLESYGEAEFEALPVHKNRLALIIFTSGATGIPKGVCLSHDNLQHTIRSITEWAQINENDRELTTLSLTHLFGLAHCHIYWTVGGTMYIEEGLQNIPAVLKRLSDEAITSFPGTPGGFRMIVDQHAELFASCAANLRYIIINSAPLEEHYIRSLMVLVPNTRVYMYYGLTEASRSSYILYNDNPTKLESVGRPTPGTEICIGSPLHPLIGEAGEILVRGPHVTEGYWGADSSGHFVDNWLKTGDLGTIDQQGFLTWKGRVKEQINVDGLKLTPTEVETVLMEHPRVKDVAVVGAPDLHTGERVVAFVSAEGRADKDLEIELRKFCKARLDFYKVPSAVIFVDAIPRTDSGKPRRLELKSRLEA